MTIRTSSLLACAVLALLAVTASAATRRGKVLIVLGDSHSDTGNTYRASNNTIPTAAHGYYMGRYSNGPVWVDHFANDTGISTYNAAFTAATACPPPIDLPLPFHVPYLAQQAEQVANASTSLPSNRAVFIWMGANDLDITGRGLLAGAFPFEVAQNVLVPNFAACLKQSAEALVRFGHTRSLVVANAHPFYNDPQWAVAAAQIPLPDGGAQFKQQMATLTVQFNELVRRDIADLAARYKRAKISMFDMAGFYFTTTAQGSVLGFTNTTGSCMMESPWDAPSGLPMLNMTYLCDNPSEHLYWDGGHPTTRAHKMLASAVEAHLAAQSPDLFA